MCHYCKCNEYVNVLPHHTSLLEADGYLITKENTYTATEKMNPENKWNNTVP